jgi:hypothetical protein
LLPVLLAAGHDVFAVVRDRRRLPVAEFEKMPGRIRIVELDLLDESFSSDYFALLKEMSLGEERSMNVSLTLKSMQGSISKASVSFWRNCIASRLLTIIRAYLF